MIIAQLQQVIEKLEKIARLGNGQEYGNSVGNILAQDCLNILGVSDVNIHWNKWYGGVPPLIEDKPVRIWWPNGIKRIYERADMICWANLKTDGSVRWRQE